MTRVLFVPLLMLSTLFALTGCNQASETTAPEPTPEVTVEAPDTPESTETPAPESVEQVIEETPEQIRARLAAQMPEDFARLGMCTDPRPEICTQNYAPVCGVHEDGSRQTYSNGCTACSNPEVVGALPEPCPE
jgi:hypothetical protein